MNLPSIAEPIENAKTIFDALDVSDTTRKDYGARIGLFQRHVRQFGFHRNSYLDFKHSLEKRSDYTVATKNKYLATAKVFSKELNRIGLLPVDITQNVKLFSQSKKHKRDGLSEEEVRAVAEKLRSLPDSSRNARLRALFCLLAFQGLRQVEIIRLDVGDIDFANQTALVRGKGMDDKEPVYLTPETVTALKAYIRTNKVGSGALFKSLGNRKSERLNTMTIKREFGELFASLGIGKTTHGFRHFYITTLLKSLDVRDVRKFSRHRSLEMLIVYDDEIEMKHKTVEVFRCFQGFNVT